MSRLRQPPVPLGLALALLLSASAQARQDPHECRDAGPGSVVTCTTVTEEPQPEELREREYRPPSPPAPVPPSPVPPVPPGPVDPDPMEKEKETPQQCIRCPPPDSPYGFGAWWWWWLPLLSLLALLLSIIALLIALGRRREEREDEHSREPIIPVPVPLPGERYPDDSYGGGVSVLPLPSAGPATCDSPLIDFLDARSEELRSVLCTLARMGVAWRRAEPDQARACVGRIETHPFYKGGQVLFDLLEWEDFMLDGEAAVADSYEVGLFIARVADWLGLPAPSAIVAGDLPPLEPGFYLYRDVVLGSLAATVATFRGTELPP